MFDFLTLKEVMARGKGAHVDTRRENNDMAMVAAIMQRMTDILV